MKTVITPQNNTIVFINAINKNCKEICKYLNQPESLFKEKYNRLISNVEKNIGVDKVAFVAPEEFFRQVYNESVRVLNNLKPVE